MEPEGSSPC